MSYSLNKQNIDRLISYLDILVESQAMEIGFECEDSTKLAYKLREAFFASRHYPEYEKYHTLQGDYKILARVHNVICKRIEKGGKHFRVEQVIVGAMQLPEITQLTGVFGAAIRFPHVEELWFPNVNLIPESKLRVYEWTAERDWQYIDHHGSGITLTKKEVEEDLLWSPEDG